MTTTNDIPNFEGLMLPLLRFAATREQCSLTDTKQALAEELQLTSEHLEARFERSGAQVFDSRLGWARKYLQEARLIESTQRGEYAITDTGRALLKENPTSLDTALLRNRYPGLAQFMKGIEEEALSAV